MKLDAYLRETGESQRGFARRAQVECKSLRRIAEGYDAVGWTWARIERATMGAVTRDDYFPDPVARRAHSA